MAAAVWIPVLALLIFQVHEQGAKSTADKAPTTRTASGGSSATTTSAPSTTPRDAEVLKELIREVERQPAIPTRGGRSPTPSSAPSSDPTGARGRDDAPVQEGGAIVERTGRLTRVGQAVEFRFERDDGKGTASFQLQPNGLLEQIERDVEAGAAQAIISGEVQRYKGKSFLLVRLYRRAAQRGNLSP